MNVPMSLLSIAIASGLALSGSAAAANHVQSPIVARANLLVAGKAATVIRSAKADGFTAKGTIVDADGTEHVRYVRDYRGLPVIGGDFVVHSKNGKLQGVSQTLKSKSRPSLNARVNGDQAIVEAGAHFEYNFFEVPSVRKVVYALGATPVLAQEVVFKGMKPDQTPTEMHYFVDAQSGKVLAQWDAVHTARPGRDGGSNCSSPVAATGTGKTLGQGDVVLNTIQCGSTYQMVDSTRGNGATHNMAMRRSGMGAVFTDGDNVWGNGLLTNAQTTAADAQYGIAMTWDYYKDEHGRLGIDGHGTGAITRVHYGRNYMNAFWSDGCYCMTFGDGDNGATTLPFATALDVAGHEMSHGVTSRSAALIYNGESGSLNEATSDIFGTMVEYYANTSVDTPDYVMGEKLYTNNDDYSQAIRYMFKPSLDNYSQDCYDPATTPTAEVHGGSGVGNHFFYLLAEGTVVPQGFGAGTWANLTPAQLVCNGNTALTGIGRDAASKIWYRALTVYMTSNTNYAEARTATLSAAEDLYGRGSTEYNAVEAAWSAVNVR